MSTEVAGLQEEAPPMPRRFVVSCLLLAALLAVFAPPTASKSWAAIGGRDGARSFFAQGHAVVQEGDRFQDRLDALRSMQVQAVTQAGGVFISPSQMGTRFEEIQREILSRPEKYVQTYQIFSEVPSDGGLYRITGMVTVSMDLLRGDLVRLGFMEEGARERSSAEDASPEGGDGARDVDPAPSQDPLPGMPLQMAQEAGDRPAASEEVLWVVPENWDDRYRLPQGDRDLSALFSQSVLQESADYSWRLTFPGHMGLMREDSGEMDTDMVLEEAQRVGVARLVLGRVALSRLPDGQRRIEAHLRIFEVPSGRLRGEIRDSVVLHGLTMEEGALQIASEAVSRLDSLFREGQAQREEPVDSGPSAEEPTPVEPGFTELHVVSSNAYAHWLELEKALRLKVPGVMVSRLDLGHGEMVVRLSGVSAGVFTEMDGTSMMENLILRAQVMGPENNRVRVTFQPAPAPEEAQPPLEGQSGEAAVETTP